MMETMEMTTVALPDLYSGSAAADPGRDNETQNNRIRNLFAGVISQALKDATYGATESHSGQYKLDNAKRGPSESAQHEKRKAWAWLTLNSEDFQGVCEMAGIDPASAGRKIRELLDRLAPAIRGYEAIVPKAGAA